MRDRCAEVVETGENPANSCDVAQHIAEVLGVMLENLTKLAKGRVVDHLLRAQRHPRGGFALVVLFAVFSYELRDRLIPPVIPMQLVQAFGYQLPDGIL